MEARINAEAAHLAARQGVSRQEANEFIKVVLAEYEDQLGEAPNGKRFDECYDLSTVQPTCEYLDLDERCKAELEGFGVEYSSLWLQPTMPGRKRYSLPLLGRGALSAASRQTRCRLDMSRSCWKDNASAKRNMKDLL
jgi:hypothetical protein